MKTLSRVFALLLLAAVSCDKSDNQNPDAKPFLVGGTSYATLQQAVDAAGDTVEKVIVMTQDASGNGAVVAGDITIDFNLFKYNLNQGCSITVDCSCLRLAADGGGLHACGNTPVISVCNGGWVVLSGDIHISSEEAVNAVDGLVETDGFCGRMDGDIFLDCSQFILNDTDCRIDADVLKVKGEGAVFSADTGNDAAVSGPVVTVGKVCSSLKHPVISMKDGVIAVDNGGVHVHKMAVRTVKGTCVTHDYIEMSCSECGYQSFEELDSYGDCPAECLEHHDAKPATDIEYGNEEYWECPFCHTAYADSKAEEELSDGIYIMPKAYVLGKEIMDDNGFILDWEDLLYDSYSSCYVPENSALPVINLIMGSISLMNGIWGTVDRLMGKEESHEWTIAFQDLDHIKLKLDLVDRKLDRVYREIKEFPYKVEISKRNTALAAMKFQVFKTDSLICRYLSDTLTVPKDTVKKRIVSAIKHWGESTYEGATFIDMTKSLMQEYRVGYLNLDFPSLWTSYVNSLCAWEHEGYGYVGQIMLNDIAYLSKAWCMALMYYNDVRNYDVPELKELDINVLKKARDSYSSTCTSGLERMKERSEKYRRLNAFGVTLNRKPVVRQEMDRWFLKHRDKLFPRDNRDNKAAENCDTFLDAYGLKDLKPMTQKMAKFIYDYHNRGKKKKNRVEIYDILRDTVGFIDCPGHYLTKSEAICLGDDTGFRSLNRDINQPAYKMLAWTTRGSDDLFGFHTIMRPEATTDTQGIIHGNISPDGRITVRTMHKWKIFVYCEAEGK